ncbi:MAG: hypothetical protein IKS17_09255 [Firmicutes bacterium]|nr:hypothetical protein [Bacillota bacterium]
MKKTAALLLSITMLFSCVNAVTVHAASQIATCGGWHECIYMTWTNDSSAAKAKAYYKKSGESNYTAVDSELVRSCNGGGRVDIPGIAQGSYDIKVVLNDGTELTKENVYTDSFDRSGYAHFGAGGVGVGAYNDDGTPKTNAKIIYVTNENKNTVTLDGAKGIAKILQTKRSYPLIVRFIGTVETRGWYLDSSDAPTQDCSENSGITSINNLTSKWTKGKDTYLNMLDTYDGISNVTIEGVGTDATILRWGFTFKKCSNIEARNLHFDKYPEDACSFIGTSSSNVSRVWLHNCTFDVGYNAPLNELYCDDKDKAEGDGSTDLAYGENVTYSYNRFNDCHKTSLNGNDNDVKQYHITWHHNYFNNVSARMPLIRQANMHSYNNYFSNCGTCIDARANAWILSEANYFEKCTYAHVTRKISGYGSAVIKSYNDVLSNSGKRAETSTIYTAASRDDTYTVSGNENPYPNFDTNSSLFYYKNGKSNVTLLQSAEQAKQTCTDEAGVMKEGAAAESGDDPTPPEPETETKLIPVTVYEPEASYFLGSGETEKNGENTVTKQSDGTYLVHDTSSNATTQWDVPFRAQKSGIVEISGTFRPTKSAGTWSFIQIKGKDGSGNALSAAFSTDKSGSKHIALFINGGYVSSGTALGTNTYNYRFIVDIDTNTVKLCVGDNIELSAVAQNGISSISSVYMMTANAAADRDFYVSLPDVERRVPKATLLGDTDKSGTVDVVDAVKTLQYINGGFELDEQGFANADAEPDGVVDGDDAAAVLKIAAGA